MLGVAAALWAAPAAALAAGPSISLDKVDASRFPTMRASVSVYTPSGQPALGLDAVSFALTEDDKPVSDLKVEPFVDASQPIAAAILVDMSGSMQDGKLDLTRKVASAFVDALRPADSASVTAFTTSIQAVQPLTSDHAALQAAIGRLKVGGNTSLYDALIDTAGKLTAAAPHRHMILLVTDGQDTTSKTSLASTLDQLQKAGVPVVIAGAGADARHDVLDRITAVTGGSAAYPSAVDAGLRSFFVSAEDRLRWAYTLSYQSHLATDSQPHKLSVKSPNTPNGPSSSSQFTLPAAPLAISVTGLTDLATISGSADVQVAVTSGTASQVLLLVDGQQRAKAGGPPFDLPWNAAAETPGLHQVVIRATAPDGSPVEKTYVENVVPPASPAPTSSIPSPPRVNGWPYLIAMLATVLVGVGAIWLFAWRARPPEAVALDGATVDEDPDVTEEIQPLPAVAPWERRPATQAEPVATAVPSPEDPITVVPLEPQRPSAGVRYRLADTPPGAGAEITTRGSASAPPAPEDEGLAQAAGSRLTSQP